MRPHLSWSVRNWLLTDGRFWPTTAVPRSATSSVRLAETLSLRHFLVAAFNMSRRRFCAASNESKNSSSMDTVLFGFSMPT